MPAWSHDSAVQLWTVGNLSADVIMPNNGQVKRMNRTIKDAIVRRFHYDSHQELRGHLADFVSAYNFPRRLKVLKGLTPY